MEQVETKVDVLAVMDSCTDELEKQPGCYYTDAAKLQEARAAIAELIEAAVEMDAVFDTYVFDYGVTQHGLSVKDRISAALARVGGGK